MDKQYSTKVMDYLSQDVIIKDIKETLCHADQRSTSLEKQYQLPDGTIINLGNELWNATQILFKQGVELLYKSIMLVDHERREMYSNVILSGGSTQFRGSVDRPRMG